MLRFALAVVAVGLAALAYADDKKDDKKTDEKAVAPTGTWTREAEGLEVSFAFKKETLTIGVSGGGNGITVKAKYTVEKDGTIRPHRVVCAVDPGYAINPDTITAQIESGIIQGLSAALSGEITFKDGRPEQSNFHDYTVLRIDEIPAIETVIVPSGNRYSQKWGGIGETGLPPVAAALANAVFAATGQRIRTLPLKNHKLWPG